ncbi:MAG: hydroxymethylglutaryl-CoA reductase [Candidatus Hodarchaeota archaeon]
MNNLSFLKSIVRHRYVTAIPTFVLGPLTFHGSIGDEEVCIPFATTEAVLPESIQRGIRAVNLSGGCNACLVADAMTRCPVFEAKSVRQALDVRRKIQKNIHVLQNIARETSGHLELTSSTCWVVGRFIYIRFAFDTGDAMGMNMVTIATEKLCAWVTERTEARVISLSSNMCSDKKAAGVNFLLGRGKTVIAEASILESVLQDVLHTSARAIVKVVIAKHFVGSGLALAQGFMNSHVANVLAGVFLATGQDLAQLVESSMGIVLAEEEERGSLYLSATIPCLEIGTVGGGTSLPYAKRSLELMGCLDRDSKTGESAKRFAEIIAGTCLAGELSLLACLAEGTLAEVHLKHRER